MRRGEDAKTRGLRLIASSSRRLKTQIVRMIGCIKFECVHIIPRKRRSVTQAIKRAPGGLCDRHASVLRPIDRRPPLWYSPAYSRIQTSTGKSTRRAGRPASRGACKLDQQASAEPTPESPPKLKSTLSIVLCPLFQCNG